MCVTLGPSRLSDTILLAATATWDGRLHHVLGYQNRVQNLDRGPNAMLLPFPARPGSMSAASVVATDRLRNALADLARAVNGYGAIRGGLVRHIREGKASRMIHGSWLS